MVDFNNIAVHMFVEEARDEIDLEWKWKNPPTKEELEEFNKI
jgi:ribosomal silencing factor RsfS